MPLPNTDLLESISEKKTRSISAVDALRSLILDGTFPLGSRLQEHKLAQLLGTSRTPVNSALTALAAEGLLIYKPHCGYVIRELSMQDVVHAIEVRTVLEGLAAKTVAQKGMDEKSRLFLKENLDESNKILFIDTWSASSQKKWFYLNRQFHDSILSLTDNSYLTNLVAQAREIPNVYYNVRHNLERGGLSKLYRREQSQKAFADHRAIFEALIKQQVDRAEFLLKDHIFKNMEDMLANHKDLINNKK